MLQNLCILVMVIDAADACELVQAIESAGGDVVAAANAYEAQQRIKQFAFHGALVDCSGGAAHVTELLQARGIPFCVCQSGADPSKAQAVPVRQAVAALAAKITA
jgi:CheY-like chemotaxis protein